MLTRDAGSDPAPGAFSPFDFSGGVVVAVSGGGDSTALLLLLKEHLARTCPAAPVLAVTVDHALRSGSAAEADSVARLCAGRGICHRIMTWTGPKPASGLPAAAREARYRLLAEAAREAGVRLIATGHTADDQAETVLMRRSRSRDADAPGLAGMAPATLYGGGFWIVRPLLGVRRDSLRAMLGRERVGWIDDPTNADQRFERPRLRARLANDGNMIRDALGVAHRVARDRQALGARAAALIRTHATRPAASLVRLAPSFAHAGDRDAAIHALRVLLAVTGGVAFPPSREPVDAVLAGSANTSRRVTLSRCVIDWRRTGVFLHREQRGLPSPENVAGEMVWDGRRRITFGDEGEALLISPLGMAAASQIAVGIEDAPAALVRAALAAEPSIHRLPGAAKPSEQPAKRHAFSAVPVCAPWSMFLPSFDLELARAVVGLVAAPPIPFSPLSSLNGVEPWSNA